MSDYTLAVNWSGKDALSDSDAAKVISGSDFNTEFTTVRTAVNSKADTNGNSGEDFAINNGTVAGTLTVTGVPTIPTASQGTNTTQAASTAFVTTAVAALDAAAINAIVYPVGSIYTNMAVATNPASLLGMGTWVAFGEGRVLVGKASSGTFDTLAATGGAETHTLTTAEIPSHTHTMEGNPDNDAGAGVPDVNTKSGSIEKTNTTTATGGGGAHNNLQPYVVVYMWKRTA
jgi:microcystin-dependent protein